MNVGTAAVTNEPGTDCLHAVLRSKPVPPLNALCTQARTHGHHEEELDYADAVDMLLVHCCTATSQASSHRRRSSWYALLGLRLSGGVCMGVTLTRGCITAEALCLLRPPHGPTNPSCSQGAAEAVRRQQLRAWGERMDGSYRCRGRRGG